MIKDPTPTLSRDRRLAPHLDLLTLVVDDGLLLLQARLQLLVPLQESLPQLGRQLEVYNTRKRTLVRTNAQCEEREERI